MQFNTPPVLELLMHLRTSQGSRKKLITLNICGDRQKAQGDSGHSCEEFSEV
jgi:hypothetical protein